MSHNRCDGEEKQSYDESQLLNDVMNHVLKEAPECAEIIDYGSSVLLHLVDVSDMSQVR
jgi:hypothetical protein